MSETRQSAPDQVNQAKAAPSAVIPIIIHALLQAAVLAIVGYVFVAQFVPFATAKSLAAIVGLELNQADLPWLCAVLGAAIGVVSGGISGYFGHRRTLERQAEFQQLAASLGAQYSAHDDSGLSTKLEPYFTNSRDMFLGVSVCNVMRVESHGIHVAVGDVTYTYESPSSSKHTDSTHTVEQTVAFLESAGSSLPDFTLQPEGLATRIMDLLGGQDIDFPAHPEFSRFYHLSAVHTENTRRLFNGQVLARLERSRGLTIKSRAHGLVLFRKDELTDPKALKHFVSEATEIFRVFSQSVQSSASTAH